MDIIIPLLIVSVLIGIPTWLIVQTVNKADKSTIIYSPEEVTRRLRKGFYLSFWGMDLLFGAIPSFVLILCDLPTSFSIYCSGCSICRWIYHVFYRKNSGRANDQIHKFLQQRENGI